MIKRIKYCVDCNKGRGEYRPVIECEGCPHFFKKDINYIECNYKAWHPYIEDKEE